MWTVNQRKGFQIKSSSNNSRAQSTHHALSSASAVHNSRAREHFFLYFFGIKFFALLALLTVIVFSAK